MLKKIFAVIMTMVFLLGLPVLVAQAQSIPDERDIWEKRIAEREAREAAERKIREAKEMAERIKFLRDTINRLREKILAQENIVDSNLEPGCLALRNNLSRGSRDSTTNGEVSKLQTFLRDYRIYPSNLITGYFGPATESAVKRFQSDKGIVSSGSPKSTGYGVVGPKTKLAIKNNCTSNQPVFSGPPVNSQSGNSGGGLGSGGTDTPVYENPDSPVVTTGELSIDLKINGKKITSLNTSVDYESLFDIEWSTVGAESCNADGSKMPVTSNSAGKVWSELGTIATSGTAVLEAKVKGVPFSPGVLFITIYCESITNESVRKTSMVQVTSDSLNEDRSKVKITAPRGGTWTLGDWKAVSWYSAIDVKEGGTIVVRVIPSDDTIPLDDTNSYYVIGEEDYTDTVGSVFEAMPDTIVPGQYVVEVKIDTPKRTVVEKSASFAVRERIPLDLSSDPVAATLTAPRGGERWKEDTERLIIWTGAVKKLRLMKDGAVVAPIGDEFLEVTNSGHYTWLVPTGLVGSGYSIQTTSGSSFSGPDVLIGQSGNFSITNINNSTDGVKPTAPTGLSLDPDGVSGTKIGLSWTASTDNVGVLEYWIYRDGDVVGKTSETSYDDSGLTREVKYTYTVRAVDVGDNVSSHSASADGTIPPLPPVLIVTQAIDTNYLSHIKKSLHTIKWRTENVWVDTTAPVDIILKNKLTHVTLTQVGSIKSEGSKASYNREVKVEIPSDSNLSTGVWHVVVVRNLGDGQNIRGRGPDFIFGPDLGGLRKYLGDNGNEFSVKGPGGSSSSYWLKRGQDHTISFKTADFGDGDYFRVYLMSKYKKQMVGLPYKNFEERGPGLSKAEVTISNDALSSFREFIVGQNVAWSNSLNKTIKDKMFYKGPFQLGVVVYKGNDIIKRGFSEDFFLYGVDQAPNTSRAIRMAWDGNQDSGRAPKWSKDDWGKEIFRTWSKDCKTGNTLPSSIPNTCIIDQTPHEFCADITDSAWYYNTCITRQNRRIKMIQF